MTDAAATSPLAGDITGGFRRWRFWTFLAWQDIKHRYRGSVIGPFWTVGNLGLTVAGIGFLYSALLRQDVVFFFPYLASGLVVWFLISGVVTESTGAFTGAASMIRHSAIPLVIFPLRVVTRGLIIMAHNLLVLLVVFLIFPTQPKILPLLYSFPLLLANLSWISVLVALLSTRYRDLGQLISQLMSFFLFVTPVFWNADALGGARAIYVIYNPFAHLLNIVRQPLLGQDPAPLSLMVCALMMLFGWAAAFVALRSSARNVVHWL